MYLREIGWNGVDWIDMAQYRDQWRALMNTVLKLRVPYNAGKFRVILNQLDTETDS
jgi:hypothetical protein